MVLTAEAVVRFAPRSTDARAIDLINICAIWNLSPETRGYLSRQGVPRFRQQRLCRYVRLLSLLSLIAAECYPNEVMWLPFDEWVVQRARHRAGFWESQDFANLERARNARWVLSQRHWPESYLPECLADLSAELPAQRRTKRRNRTTRTK